MVEKKTRTNCPAHNLETERGAEGKRSFSLHSCISWELGQNLTQKSVTCIIYTDFIGGKTSPDKRFAKKIKEMYIAFSKTLFSS